jgi:hypothetical protein
VFLPIALAGELAVRSFVFHILLPPVFFPPHYKTGTGQSRTLDTGKRNPCLVFTSCFLTHLSQLKFQFGFDADILEIMLNELADVVDKFFIMESTKTHNKVSC